MGKNNASPPENSIQETIMEDSVLTGVLAPLGCTFTPETDESGHVQFRVVGDIDGCLAKLYQNHPVGSLDILKAIKATRQAIFTCRKGKGRYNGTTFSR